MTHTYKIEMLVDATDDTLDGQAKACGLQQIGGDARVMAVIRKVLAQHGIMIQDISVVHEDAR